MFVWYVWMDAYTFHDLNEITIAAYVAGEECGEYTAKITSQLISLYFALNTLV